MRKNHHRQICQPEVEVCVLLIQPRGRALLISGQPLNPEPLLTFDERDFRAVTPLAGGSFTVLPRDSTGG